MGKTEEVAIDIRTFREHGGLSHAPKSCFEKVVATQVRLFGIVALSVSRRCGTTADDA